MFESLVSNIRKKFSKTDDDISDHGDSAEKTGFKRSLHVFKSKLLKTEATSLPVPQTDNLSLSPRASGLAECAQTEIEWPILTDKHPNILDRFTRIVTKSGDINCGRVRLIIVTRRKITLLVLRLNIIYYLQKHNDREEIRRRLAMGADAEEYYSMGYIERPGKKPSLHSRLQNGMLQKYIL